VGCCCGSESSDRVSFTKSLLFFLSFCPVITRYLCVLIVWWFSFVVCLCGWTTEIYYTDRQVATCFATLNDCMYFSLLSPPLTYLLVSRSQSLVIWKIVLLFVSDACVSCFRGINGQWISQFCLQSRTHKFGIPIGFPSRERQSLQWNVIPFQRRCFTFMSKRICLACNLLSLCLVLLLSSSQSSSSHLLNLWLLISLVWNLEVE